MPVTERLRAAGSWSLNLREDTPKSILDDLDIATRGFGLLIITPAKIPSTALTAALLRGMSRYVGVYRARPNDYAMQGAHASILLGDEDGKGEILSAVTSQVAASLSTWMTALLPSNGIAKGTVSGGSTLSASYIYMSRRQAIDAVCDGCGADWLVRCNSAGDLVLDASPKATLFGSAAAALATRRAMGGKEPGIASLRATQLATAMDVEDYTTKVWLIARGDGGATVGTATAGSVPYFGPGGAAIKMERIIDAPNVDPGNETTIATLQLANFSSLRRAITLSTDEYDISGVVRPGQNIYVYDPVINLYDNAVEQYFRGETIHPLLMRCFGHTWPIRAGFGVYFQTPEASPRIINLSDWFIPEEGDTSVEVGATSRQVGAGVVTLGTPIDNQAGVAVGSVGGVQRVTAGTRPTLGLYAGMLIYETDTLELRMYNGSEWVKVGGTGAWTAYTPTWSGTIGNGTLNGTWMRIGRTIHWRANVLWGSTTSHAAAAQSLSVPVAPVVATYAFPVGQCVCMDAGVITWWGFVSMNGGLGTSLVAGISQNGTTAGLLNHIVPFTWGNGDILYAEGTYEAAAS